MGAKNKAPDPKPEMTIPLAMPLLSGNHSIKASVLKKYAFYNLYVKSRILLIQFSQ